ncbi:transcriptional regulator [Trichoderma arundinaceum]|uniref:Transcriptional regulator n=1 Tax=Trichoderma arundinaceum TaxID=490622 RepID=A0A395NVE4_TRIAR|nr:transcriptional regulator [Trichoderma arundinaceum]
MAPSAAQLKEALTEGTQEVYKAEPDGTSVNKVRRHVEEKLGLEDGFFTSDAWKQKSKTIIKEQVDKLLLEDASEPEHEADTKVGIKRQSSEVESPQPKRRKKTSGPAKKKEESDGDEAPKRESSAKVKKLVSRRKTKTDDSDEEGAKPEGSASPARSRKRSMKQESEDESKPSISDEGDVTRVKKQETPGDEIKPSIKAQSDSGAEDAKAVVKDESKLEINEEDEYSDVIDEPQPTKRKRAEKKETPSSKSKGSKAPTKKEAATPEDPKDAEIKKLQSQLAKCGIRKLWHIELKQHGDNAGAKIRHLKKMLADIGMDGRFSEAKAREIKEMRELQADVEAAQEMDRLWGTSSGGRASRSKAKTTKQEAKVESGDDNEDDGNDDDEPTSFAARRRKAHADLAFLGDESDSD